MHLQLVKKKNGEKSNVQLNVKVTSSPMGAQVQPCGRVELPTPGLRDQCSATELTGLCDKH